jgi:Fe(3+) dicitrate transport protein
MTDLVATLLDPLLDPASRTFWPALLSGAMLAVFFTGSVSGGLSLARWWSPSGRVDLQLVLIRQLTAALGWAPRFGSVAGFAVGTVAVLDQLGPRPALGVPPAVVIAGYTLALFLAWDLSRYALHRLMHAVPALWAFHQVHHSAPTLTPLTFHRVHPVESALYFLRGVVVTGTLAGGAFWAFGGAAVEWELLGVSGVGMLLNVATGSLRHSHVWLRFPAGLERWLLSPAQHQLHHAVDPAMQQSNYGTWLAVWDVLAGSWVPAPATPPAALGVEGANHDPHDVVSALFGPVRALVPRRWLAALGLASGAAAAAEPVPEEDAPYTVIVDSDDGGVVHEAGSAHVLTEEDLQRHAFDDVHRVLAAVPGVYVRGEDGYGLRPNIGMRGGSSDRSAKVTLLEDGVPLAPAPYASPAAYYFPMPMRFVGVEVFKGPSAVRFGPQTVGGTVNVLTRRVPSTTEGAVDLDAGAFGTVSGHAWGALANERAGVLVESANLTTQGFKTLPDGGPTGFVRQDLMVKGRLGSDPSADQHASMLELKLGYGRERSYETYLGLATADARRDPYARYQASALDRMDWQRTQAELSFATVGRSHDLRVVAWHHGLWRAWRKVNRFQDGPDLHDLLQDPGDGASAVFLELLRGTVDTADADQQLMIGTNDRQFQTVGALAVGHQRAHGRWWSHALELGLRAELDEVQRVHTEDPFALVSGRPIPVADAETVLLLDSDTRALALAPHVHEDLALGPVHLQPGLRMELVTGASGTRASGPVDPHTTTQLLPGFAVLGQAEGVLDLFAGVHRGYSPAPPEADPDQRPETAWSGEVGARLYPGQTHLELVGFLSAYQEISGVCTLSGGCDPSQLDQQFNGGSATVGGLEALAGQELPLPGEGALGGLATYTFTRTQFDTGFASPFPQWGVVTEGDALPYVPVHQGALQLYADHPAGGGSISARYRGEMRDAAGQGDLPALERIPPLFLVDLAGRAGLSGSVSATATVTNVLGTSATESLRPFGSRPTAPRTWMLGIRAGAW